MQSGKGFGIWSSPCWPEGSRYSEQSWKRVGVRIIPVRQWVWREMTSGWNDNWGRSQLDRRKSQSEMSSRIQVTMRWGAGSQDAACTRTWEGGGVYLQKHWCQAYQTLSLGGSKGLDISIVLWLGIFEVYCEAVMSNSPGTLPENNSLSILAIHFSCRLKRPTSK